MRILHSADDQALQAKKVLLALLLVSFMFVGSFGVLHFGMDMGVDGQMSGCPFIGMTAICQMTPFEHISAWQNMFTSLPGFKDAASLILLLLASFFGFAWIGRIPIRASAVRQQPLRHVRKYIAPANPLQELFSNGILHPKIF